MSANPILAKGKLAVYFAQLLNISIDDEFSMMDMEEELETILDIDLFRKYVKDRFSYSAYQYMTGYQKFIALARDFRKDNAPKLDDQTEMKVYSYTTRLLSKLTNFTNNLHFEVQAKGYDLGKINLEKTYEKALTDKDMEICRMIGFKTIYKYATRNIPKLEAELERVITQKTFQVKYPQLANNKKEFEGMGTIERLKLQRVGA